MEPGRAPADFDLEADDLVARLSDTFLEVSTPRRPRKHRYHLLETLELPEQQLTIPLRRFGTRRGKPAQLRLPVQGVLDRVAGRIVLGRKPGPTPLHRGSQKRYAASMATAQVGERTAEKLEQTHSLPCQTDRR